ncbi:FkbM family methyltransferase [Streptomyces sp. TRM66268-LWL]|uniref:FkbM family methyltransferase n=1 Tax=Streptomyces polyasparticus TaxID=2767826 RepID=A0ABR7SLU7_9ACTN|nr:FkbM family methyltransferase [Streptomyces polyasparticus]MBC9715303.1 FkbM family methyltransferase [Streptomyces polyasparticus]
MATLFRRLLRTLPRFGVHVLDLEPGAAVVSRRGRWKHARFGGAGAHLLVRAGQDVADEREFQLAAAQYLCHHHVAGILDKYEVNCVFDVGANAGQYAKRLRRSGYKGRIVSFEPVPLTFERLREAAANDPDWLVHNYALGSEEGTSTIHIDWKTMNSLLPPSDYGRGRYKRFKNGRTEEITVRRLDAVIDEALDGIAAPCPYLKMDTQGFDLQVFEGGGKRIDEFVGLQSEIAPLRLYEGSPAMAESIAAYESRGFGITGMYPVTREPATGRVVEFDCVMVRPEAAR